MKIKYFINDALQEFAAKNATEVKTFIRDNLDDFQENSTIFTFEKFPPSLLKSLTFFLKPDFADTLTTLSNDVWYTFNDLNKMLRLRVALREAKQIVEVREKQLALVKALR